MSSSKPRTTRPQAYDIWSLIATAYPIGLARYAPGTWGSLLGLAVGAFIYEVTQYQARMLGHSYPLTLIGLLGLLFWLAWYSIDHTERRWDVHDDGRIVIDEILGQAIPISMLGYSVWTLVLSFVLFRALDIRKPGPIGWLDRNLPGAWGTLLDDVLAGVCVWPLVFLLSSLQALIV